MTFASDLFINCTEVRSAVMLTTSALTMIMTLTVLNTPSVLSMTRQFN